MADDAIRVVGLSELRRELRAAGTGFPKEIRQANKTIADMVAERTRSTLSVMGGSAPKVAPTVKALAQQARAQVKVGGGSTIGGAVAMGNIWGARFYPQFPPNIKGGYALYPAIKELRDEISTTYLKSIDRITRKAFPS